MRRLMLLLAFSGLCLSGCKKTVPTDIVQKSMKNALLFHAPITVSAMCGAQTKGLTNAVVTNVVKGKENVGTAHVKGSPFLAPGTPPSCEGDFEFRYSYKTKSRRVGRKTVTDTYWTLEHLKLTAVQTPSVVFKAAEEDSSDEDDQGNAP